MAKYFFGHQILWKLPIVVAERSIKDENEFERWSNQLTVCQIAHSTLGSADHSSH